MVSRPASWRSSCRLRGLPAPRSTTTSTADSWRSRSLSSPVTKSGFLTNTLRPCARTSLKQRSDVVGVEVIELDVVEALAGGALQLLTQVAPEACAIGIGRRLTVSVVNIVGRQIGRVIA